jgi:hypothetical protein
MNTRIYTCTHFLECISLYMHACVYGYMLAHTHIHIHSLLLPHRYFVQLQAYIRVCVCVYICMYIHSLMQLVAKPCSQPQRHLVQLQAYIRICVYTYVGIYIALCNLSPSLCIQMYAYT